MTIKVTPTEKPTHIQEHTIQVQLINLLVNAVTEDRGRDEVVKILDQLMQFSQVHFMSEQLIMRQHSFDGFDEHENEHGELIDQLQESKQGILSDETRLNKEGVYQLREKLLSHIATQDQKLSAFLSNQNQGSFN
jgi:hemerythrin